MADDGEQEVRGRVGDNLKLERLLRRESQEALARRAGVHRTQISLFENGERTMLLLTFVRLCGALGLTPSKLLDGVSFEPGRFDNGAFQVVDSKAWKR